MRKHLMNMNGLGSGSASLCSQWEKAMHKFYDLKVMNLGSGLHLSASAVEEGGEKAIISVFCHRSNLRSFYLLLSSHFTFTFTLVGNAALKSFDEIKRESFIFSELILCNDRFEINASSKSGCI